MWRTLWGLLIATSALAADYNGHYGQPRRGSVMSPKLEPIDLDDDIYNKDFWSKPNSNIMFNFEQTRRDQPPQVEVRTEDVGRYLNRKPKTTTTLAPIIELESEEYSSEMSDEDTSDETIPVYVPLDKKTVHKTPKTHYVPTMVDSVPPVQPVEYYMRTPVEQFEEEDQDAPVEPLPRFVPPYPTRTETVPTTTETVSTTTTESVTPVTLKEHKRKRRPHRGRQTPQPQYTPMTVQETTTIKPVVIEEFTVPPTTTKRPRSEKARKSSRSRGNRKFSWADFTTIAPQPIITSTTYAPGPMSPLFGHPPPPVPTLSPWYDGFGK